MIDPIFAAGVLAGLALPMLPTNGSQAERRLYWAGACLATSSAFFALYPPDWRSGLVFAALIGGITVLRAYMTTPYIRVRGRTYAFNLSDDDAAHAGCESSYYESGQRNVPASYAGIATAAKMWWLFVVVTIVFTAIVVMAILSAQGFWYAAGAGTVGGLLALMVGHQDASWGYKVARGQRVQFALAGLATVGLFTVLYLAAFAVGSRWPLRSRRSPEYRPGDQSSAE